FCLRYSTMRWAMLGPTRGSRASWAASAVLTLTFLPSAAAPGSAARRTARTTPATMRWECFMIAFLSLATAFEVRLRFDCWIPFRAPFRFAVFVATSSPWLTADGQDQGACQE